MSDNENNNRNNSWTRLQRDPSHGIMHRGQSHGDWTHRGHGFDPRCVPFSFFFGVAITMKQKNTKQRGRLYYLAGSTMT